ncbi:paternally-expressed gene 3 protein-like [Dendronephthya gigantea]|uniref:paternally-expressed gene 3 protein-like n=1 Tax=Dendronephthya gigantea TaxID=151771 RepID=UPI00106BDB01|nr:paternally-expressed gene 3 protein-like [Dendronephthya gigantea]
MNNFTCLFILTILSLSQGFPRPSLDKANRRQGVHYGYPESSSEPYTSTQATSYSENPSYATTWSKPAESTTSNPASQESIASYQNPAADQNSPARETTTASPYAAQTADRPTETPQDQSKQTQTQADQNTSQKPTTQSPYASQTADRQAETAQAQNTQAQTQSGQTSAQQAATDTSTQDQSSQTQGDQSSSQKATTSSPYAASQSPNTPQGQDTQSKTSTSQTQDSTSPQKPATQTQDSTSPQNPATQTQDSTSPQNPATQTQDSTSPQNPATQTQDATSPQNPATQTQDSTSSQNPATQTQDSTTPQSPATQTQDSTSPQNPATQTQDSTSPQNTASQTSTQSTADTSSTQTQAQAPQNQDPSTAPNQPQASQSSTQSQSETQLSSQATQGGQSNDYNQNKGNNEYVNPPKPYNEAQSNPQSASSSDNSQYKVDKVISKTASDSSQGNPSSPVYLSTSGTANVADSSKPDDKSKSATVNKETTVNGNHATTYLELPKIIHKPAIVKYQVQIAPKVKGVPIEQEIAIMPPDGGKGERKPLVLLKQVVSKPTDERIQVIVPKSESSTISSPKVEVKGGHLDQEALNGQDQANGQNQDRGQGQPQGQYQGQGQEQSQSQDQTQSQDQSQDSACGDLSMCENYNPNMCNQVWMKRHCKKLCGLCTPPEDEISLSSAPSEETSGPKHCEYSGVIHQSGETWSPGPCVPKCHCNNGIIKCSKLECPDLNCDKPIKRRWKCCPECLPNSDNETRCGVDTTGGNAENLCCVFPFNYRGIDYFTCTTADAQEPWCSITRNYDRDGLWGNCVAKSETEKKHVKQADSDEKTALVLAAQLSGARKWRNSTNNQATEALKDVHTPFVPERSRSTKSK